MCTVDWHSPKCCADSRRSPGHRNQTASLELAPRGSRKQHLVTALARKNICLTVILLSMCNAG